MQDNPPQILILGGTGKVGKTVCDYLLKNTLCQLNIVTRNTKPDLTEYADYSGRLTALNFDALNKEQLSQHCKEADLVISCIGPSQVIGSTIVDICYRTVTPYIDAGGYDPLLKHLANLVATEPAKVPLIINAGLLPGLSGVYPKYLIDQYASNETITSLEVSYVGRDAWSYNSAWDIIVGLGDFGEDRGFCYIADKQLIKVPFYKATQKKVFPAPIGKVGTMLIYSEELRRLINQYQIPNLKVYGANIGAKAAFSCAISKIFGQYKTPEKLAKAAKRLASASAKDMLKSDPIYAIQAEIQLANGQQITGSLLTGDTYYATGTVIAITAKYLLENTIAAGAYSLHEAIPSEVIIEQLQAQQIIQLITTTNDSLKRSEAI
ncbi:saccharopine dehydrogenase [Entomomonas moraniae]|uniref:Saccharopine dehydrogenase n=1 Tax=Entomomonas moraniae TaxID=2213226 RepID=A0A3S9XD33_9GAMM|nr:saccharopine dehydrogenase NADP-binding domain-containing protein [Entomomonas moraniae]AZS50301.1 saccharopine dehydrogenase [Entomomonas moraniae]